MINIIFLKIHQNTHKQLHKKYKYTSVQQKQFPNL